MNKINAKIKVTNVTGSNANMNKSINKTNLDTKVLIKKAKKIQKYTNDNDVVEKDESKKKDNSKIIHEYLFENQLVLIDF